MDNKIQKLIDRALHEKRGISILNTHHELRSFYLDNVSQYKKWRAIASIEDWLPVDPMFLTDFRQKLSDAGVETCVIFKEKGLQYEKPLKNRSVKTIPDSYVFKSSIDILEDKILIMNPHQTILGLVIESPVLVDIFIDVFDMFWELLPAPSAKE